MSPAAHQDRVVAAEIRATDAYRSVTRLAHNLAEELDDLTETGAYPRVEIHDEDSAVIAVEGALRQSLEQVGSRVVDPEAAPRVLVVRRR